MERPKRTRLHRGSSTAGERFEFIGGHLALDFVNTLGGRRGGSTRELMDTYADLVTWGLGASIVTPEEAEHLLQAALLHPVHAVAVLERAHRLREAIYALVAARMRNDAAQSTNLAALNSELAQSLVHRRVTTGATGMAWTWDWRAEGVTGDSDGQGNPILVLDGVLWPVAVAAADLLTIHNHPPLRECASDACSWLYLDTTRNHSRRWCDMKGCGNQAKVRRYRQRQTR